MLGECIIRNPIIDGPRLDVGLILESLLFFDKVRVDLDLGSAAFLAKYIDLDSIKNLIQLDILSFNFNPASLGVKTSNFNGLIEHSLVHFSLAADVNGKKFSSGRQILEHSFERGLGKSANKKLQRDILAKIKIDKNQDFSEIDRLTKNDLQNRDILNCVLLETFAANGIFNIDPGKIVFDVMFSGENKFVIETSLNFEQLSLQHGLEAGALSAAHVVSALFNARASVFRAANRGASFVGGDGQLAISDKILKSTLGAPSQFKQKFDSIYRIVSVEAPSIRSVINSGERTAVDFLKLYEKSGKFKKWLSNQDPEEDLFVEMIKEKSQDGWLSSTKAKNFRFGLSALAGAVEPITGFVIGAADAALDPLLKRWRPHYFVENDLKDFLLVNQKND